jgi:hypothetical protein
MNRHDEEDDLWLALAGLPEADLDPRRTREVLEKATRTLTRHNRFGRARAVAGRFYVGVFEPVAAWLLSLAMLASTLAQAVHVLHQGIGLWR